ncbi:MAG: hypothetical protein FD143_2268, partial [Ignavibacteria bacterium]
FFAEGRKQNVISKHFTFGVNPDKHGKILIGFIN